MKQKTLEQIGLNKNEALVYEVVLESGEITPPKVAEISRLSRQNSYAVLKGLVEKGLIVCTEKRKKQIYKPAPPGALLEMVGSKKNELEAAETALLSVLPEIQSLFNLSNSKPGVSFFEGVDGLKKIYEDTLRVGEPIFAFLSPQSVVPPLYHWLTKNYVRRRVQKGIQAKVIIPQNDNADYRSMDKEELRESMVIRKTFFSIDIEINICGNKVAFINYAEKNKLIGFVIEDRLIAESMRSVFNLCWDCQSPKKHRSK